EAATKVLNGRDLSGSLRHPALPLLVVNLSAVGEKAGSLDHVMGELGNHYDRELQNSIKRMSNAIEPLMILMIGGMVGFVYYAFFQAIFSLAG
ncbi:MAG: type II secretion system F family protein, partial [Colwellia sp.]